MKFLRRWYEMVRLWGGARYSCDTLQGLRNKITIEVCATWNEKREGEAREREAREEEEARDRQEREGRKNKMHSPVVFLQYPPLAESSPDRR